MIRYDYILTARKGQKHMNLWPFGDVAFQYTFFGGSGAINNIRTLYVSLCIYIANNIESMYCLFLWIFIFGVVKLSMLQICRLWVVQSQLHPKLWNPDLHQRFQHSWWMCVTFDAFDSATSKLPDQFLVKSWRSRSSLAAFTVVRTPHWSSPILQLRVPPTNEHICYSTMTSISYTIK